MSAFRPIADISRVSAFDPKQTLGARFTLAGEWPGAECVHRFRRGSQLAKLTRARRARNRLLFRPTVE
jgi:hypothetical protein